MVVREGTGLAPQCGLGCVRRTQCGLRCVRRTQGGLRGVQRTQGHIGALADSAQAAGGDEAGAAGQVVVVLDLREHAAGLDTVVREEIRHTFIEEMQVLADDSRRASEALRRLRRVANLRLLLWMAAIVGVAAVVPFVIALYLLPTRAELATLAARRAELAANVARLTLQGGNVELRRCGVARRLCVHVDRGAPAYGESGEFLVVKGY